MPKLLNDEMLDIILNGKLPPGFELDMTVEQVVELCGGSESGRMKYVHVRKRRHTRKEYYRHDVLPNITALYMNTVELIFTENRLRRVVVRIDMGRVWYPAALSKEWLLGVQELSLETLKSVLREHDTPCKKEIQPNWDKSTFVEVDNPGTGLLFDEAGHFMRFDINYIRQELRPHVKMVPCDE